MRNQLLHILCADINTHHIGIKKYPWKYLCCFCVVVAAFSSTLLLVSCDRHTAAWAQMDIAESLMETEPDSALTILNKINLAKMTDGEETARYALLKSMALDKNYVDTTTLDILLPAIQYYTHNGSADDKLRTLYYEGRIYQNRSDFDMAMQSFLKAEDLKNDINDTLTYANLLVARGILNYRSYQMKEYVSNNLDAARLYKKIGNVCYQMSSLIKALDGCIALNDKRRSDSIMFIVDSLETNTPDFREDLALVKLSYKINFESILSIDATLDSITDYSTIGNEAKLDISIGYLKLNEPQKAMKIFEMIDTCSFIYKSIKYQLTKAYVLEANGKYIEALKAYKSYFAANENENSKIYSQKTAVAQERHELTLANLYEKQSKDKFIWLSLCIFLSLTIIIGFISYCLHLGRIKRELAEKEQHRLKLENENLQKQNSVLELERHNTKLEYDKQLLEAENMRLKISQLENEGENLRKLLKKAELSSPIIEAIQERIGMLNGLLAAQITENETYSKPYDAWINKVTEDKNKFMNSTRLAFKASHAKFMQYLEDHGLNETEINYVCLYAIGLRGKEVGEYIQVKRHYHISSDVRKKLGLQEQETNLGIYIRNLMKQL